MQKLCDDFFKSLSNHFTEEELNHIGDKASKGFIKLTNGYHINLDELTKNATYPIQSDQTIIIKDIEIISLCKHHLLPSFGKCYLAYIPNGYIMGFARIVKIINALAHRLTLQEILTEDILNLLVKILNPKSMGLMISAQHLCMKIDDFSNNNLITTIKLFGEFSANEFISLIQAPHNFAFPPNL